MTRRLALLLAGVVAAAGLGVLPAAHADEPAGHDAAVNVPASQWGCAWIDAVDLGVCLSG